MQYLRRTTDAALRQSPELTFPLRRRPLTALGEGSERPYSRQRGVWAMHHPLQKYLRVVESLITHGVGCHLSFPSHSCLPAACRRHSWSRACSSCERFLPRHQKRAKPAGVGVRQQLPPRRRTVMLCLSVVRCRRRGSRLGERNYLRGQRAAHGTRHTSNPGRGWGYPKFFVHNYVLCCKLDGPE